MARSSEAKKAEDILVLDVRRLCSFSDYFVIATGLSRLQLRGIHDEVIEKLKELDIKPINIDGLQTTRWIVLDYGDVILHILNPEARRYYDLERLWGDAKTVRWHDTAVKRARNKTTKRRTARTN